MKKSTLLILTTCISMVIAGCNNTSGKQEEKQQPAKGLTETGQTEQAVGKPSETVNQAVDPDDPKAEIKKLIENYLSPDNKVKPLFLINNKEATPEEIQALDANKIISYTLLKNKPAETLYGERGKNGVILVEQ